MKATIIIEEVELEIEFDYQPEEKEVRYYSDGSGYPGCPESIEINYIGHKGEDIYELLTKETLGRIEDKVFEHLHSREDY